MEDVPKPHSESEKDEPKVESSIPETEGEKKSRRRRFLDWLGRGAFRSPESVFQSSSESEVAERDEDDEEESEEKSGFQRAKAAFRNLLKKEVEQSTVSEDEVPTPHAPEPPGVDHGADGELFVSHAAETGPLQEPESSDNNVLEEEPATNMPEVPNAPVVERVSSEPAPISEPEIPIADDEVPPEMRRADFPLAPDADLAGSPRGFIDRLPPSPAPTPDVVVERHAGGALAAFAAAELFSRSRDKKIRKELREVARTVEKGTQDTKVLQSDLGWVTERAQRSEERLKEISNIAQESPRQHLETASSSEIRTPSSQMAELNKNPENPSESAKVILEQAKVAAERNVPLESYHELRHEAKDVTSIPSAASVQQIIEARMKEQPLSSQSEALLSLATKAKDEATANFKRAQQEQMYRRAVIGGAWAAAVILLFLAILAITR